MAVDYGAAGTHRCSAVTVPVNFATKRPFPSFNGGLTGSHHRVSALIERDYEDCTAIDTHGSLTVAE